MIRCVVLQVLPGGHGARTYQDERFSYVVLRRGARPAPHTVPELTIARQRQIDPPDAVQQAIEAGEISSTGAQQLCQNSQATLYFKGATLYFKGAITLQMLNTGFAGRLKIGWNLTVTPCLCSHVACCLCPWHQDSLSQSVYTQHRPL